MATVHETETQQLRRSTVAPVAAAPAHRGWLMLLALFVAAEVAWLGLIGFGFYRLVT